MGASGPRALRVGRAPSRLAPSRGRRRAGRVRSRPVPRTERSAIQWPTIDPHAALVLLAIFVGVAVTQGIAMASVLRARGFPAFLWLEIAGYVAGACGAWLGLPVVQLAVANARDLRRGVGRAALVHVGAYVGFTVIHTSVMILLRALVGLASPLVAARFGTPLGQALYEMQSDLVLYPALAALWYALRSLDDRRRADVRAAELERDLAQARLEALSARLDPHFLFNALHTIGALMHEDLARTDVLIAGLGDVLRATLREDGALWTLREERMHTETYVRIQQARFGERLDVAWRPAAWPTAMLEARVPRFSLQSLVENAIKHNAEREAPLHVTLEAAVEGEHIVLSVEDDGVGLARRIPGRGSGLRHLEETLRLALGEEATLTLGDAATGGARVVLRAPLSHREPSP